MTDAVSFRLGLSIPSSAEECVACTNIAQWSICRPPASDPASWRKTNSLECEYRNWYLNLTRTAGTRMANRAHFAALDGLPILRPILV